MEQMKEKPSFIELLNTQKDKLDEIVKNLSCLKNNRFNTEFLSLYQVSIIDCLVFLERVTGNEKSLSYKVCDFDCINFRDLQKLILSHLEKIKEVMKKIKENDYNMLFYLSFSVQNVYNCFNCHLEDLKNGKQRKQRKR